MALIPNLSDIPELKPVPEGEYDLRIIKAKEKTSEGGRKGIMLVHEIIGEDNAQNMIDNLWLPMDSDDSSKAQTMLRMLKERLTAMGLPTDGSMETSEFEGVQFTAILGFESDPKYGDRNFIKRIV